MSTLICEQHDSFQFERTLRSRGFSFIAGLDEVGRGPLAGPVVAACVILPPSCDHTLFLDSKKLSAKRREHLSLILKDINATISIASVSPGTIDSINILQASLLAMKRAVKKLSSRGLSPDFLLVDGKFKVPLATPQEALIRGESKSASIAAASIVAKVFRDALMEKYHKKYPVYNFSNNKGYPTREHREAVKINGPCPIHRQSFKGVRQFV